MIELPVKDTSNQELRTVQLNETVFGRPMRKDLLSAAVTYQLAKRRSGTASSKGRAEIRGGGKKPYRQKGTGNARQGTTRAPQFRTGGIVFGPKPRSFAVKMPRKMRRLALQTALSAKVDAGEIIVVDAFGLDQIKTKRMGEILTTLTAGRSTLVVLAEEDRNVALSARNIPRVTTQLAVGVNVYDLLLHEKVILTEAALKSLEEKLG